MTEDIILLGHGSGGRLSRKLVEEIISPVLGSGERFGLLDSAALRINSEHIAFTTDSYIIDPIFFPGGDIGKLAITGTVNDLLMIGARPLYISLGMIIEEGLPIADLKRIILSIKETADASGVIVATGDTKILPKGKGDKIFINTSGIGEIIVSTPLEPSRIKSGDSIILTGSLGDHSTAVLIARENLAVRSSLVSDCASLTEPILELLEAKLDIKCMRDPTRGGLAAVLNEMASPLDLEIFIEESKIPIAKEVNAVCEILGLDPLYMANEGKAVIFISSKDEDRALNILRNHKVTSDAVVIGMVRNLPSGRKGRVVMRTLTGGERLVQMPLTEQLPRIC